MRMASKISFSLLFFFIICFVAAEEKVTDTPTEQFSDEILDQLDEHLTDNEKKKQMIICLDLSQKHFVEHREEYQKVAVSLAESQSQKADDVLRAMFHQMLVTCYFNIKKEQISLYAENSLTDKDKRSIMWKQDNTPSHFSTSQIRMMEKVLELETPHKEKGEEKKKAKKRTFKITGFRPYLYFIAISVIISFTFYYGYYTLKSFEERTNKKTKNKKN